MVRSQSQARIVALRDAAQLPADAGRTAIVLNANAKRVTEKVRRKVLAAAPNADVFFTESLDQAAFVARRVVERGYGTVLTGGGDGTVVNTLQQVLDAATQLGAPTPRFGVLRLGTGNAVADYLGAGRYEDDLARIDQAPVKRVDLLRLGDGRRTTFGGLGWDAHILDNYDKLKTAAERFAVTRALFKTAAGYLIAGVGKSVPEFLLQRPRWNLKVINTGDMAWRIDESGNVVERFGPGAVVYDAPVRMACFGTTPYYGFKFCMMPFAGRNAGLFQLRLLDLSPLSAVRRLPKIWRTGQLNHPGCTDLQLSACRLEFEQDAPLQLSGDAAGHARSLDLRLDAPLSMLDFTR